MARTARGMECWLLDTDGVLVHGHAAAPGAAELLEAWGRRHLRYLVVTNNPSYTPRDLSARLGASGLNVPESHIWTSALATAGFIARQKPGATVYCIGEAGLTTALHEAGVVLTDRHPDFVVLGETRTYSFEAITLAVRLIQAFARFIATNPDPTGPSLDGVVPATGAVAALVTSAKHRKPYVIGKPNPMVLRSAMDRINAHAERMGMVGDRMDTGVVAGMGAGLYTVLVLSGITRREDIDAFPYRPDLVAQSIADLLAVK